MAIYRFILLALSASVLLLTTTPSHAAFTESVGVVTVRPGVTQSYLILTPEKPVATVILFAGYGGFLDITKWGIQQPSRNFLVRSRDLFAKRNFITVVIDTPSDFSSVDGILGLRATKTHAQDIQKVITKLRQTTDVPLWLVGTSRGTISVANAAARLQENGPDGIVLTATVVEAGGRNSGYVGDVDLEKIRVPTLIVHHDEDDCVVCDFHTAQQLPSKIKNASRIEFVAVSGGKQAQSRSCGPLSEHGFFGIEKTVIDRIAAWITQP